MSAGTNQKVSVAFPVYNEEQSLVVLYERVKDACKKAMADYEMIFIDNGSTDGSLEIIKKLGDKDKNVKYISLSRNFGHQSALFAGMSYATGDAVITMDADLQHPPALIPKMIELWRNGTEVVYTTKEDPIISYFKMLFVKTFYWLISKLSGLQLDCGQSDFRLLDKKVLKAILEIPEYHKFLRGQVRWVGFRQKGLLYKVDNRYGGKSKFSYLNLFSFALDGIFAFSRNPLRIVTLIGIIVSLFSLGYSCFVFFVWMLNIFGIPHSLPFPPGWATLTVSIFFLGSIQLIAIGIVGEYIGRIYDQTKGRPVFIAREMSGGER